MQQLHATKYKIADAEVSCSEKPCSCVGGKGLVHVSTSIISQDVTMDEINVDKSYLWSNVYVNMCRRWLLNMFRESNKNNQDKKINVLCKYKYIYTHIYTYKYIYINIYI